MFRVIAISAAITRPVAKNASTDSTGTELR